jgi:hypothetical protein
MQAVARASAFAQLNTQLSTEVQQGQSAAARLEVKLEQLAAQLAASQCEAAAASAAAAATAASEDDALEAATAFSAFADDLQAQLKSEVAVLKSELAGAQAKASRAELELAVARSKILVAQQVGCCWCRCRAGQAARGSQARNGTAQQLLTHSVPACVLVPHPCYGRRQQHRRTGRSSWRVTRAA